MEQASPRATSHLTRLPIRCLALLIFLNGALTILEVVYVHLPHNLEFYEPIDFIYFSRMAAVFAGFLLIYFSGQLLAQKRLAWAVTSMALIFTAINHLLAVRNLPSLLMPLLGLLFLILYRERFFVRSERSNMIQGFGMLMLALVVATIYGTLGFMRFLPREFSPPQIASLGEAVVRTAREFSLLGNPDIRPLTRRADWFLDSLRLLGVASMGFAIFNLFRPLTDKYVAQPHDRLRATKLLARFGTSSEDVFKLWPEDKAYYFLPEGSSFIAYKVVRGAALVVGTPVGPAAELLATVESFKDYCRVHNWTVALLYVTRQERGYYEPLGFRALKIGDDAIIDIATFTQQTACNKHFRAVRNKFRRQECTFAISEAPHTPEILEQTGQVEQAWLSIPGRQERGFLLGYYDRQYIQRNRLYLVHDKSGKLVAFANAVHSYNPRQATIDLMRYDPHSISNAMDFLLLSVIEHLSSQGLQEFSLGLAPLSRQTAGTTLKDRAIQLAGQLGLGDSYDGLLRFKAKFRPRWESRYILYERSAIGLPRIAAALKAVLRSR